MIEARRPDMIVIDKETKFAKIIDFAIPYDSRVNSKEVEKIEKYKDLAREIKKLWGVRVTAIPIVVGTLGTTQKKLKKRLEDIGIETQGSLSCKNCDITFCQDSEKGSRDLRNLVDAKPREHITIDI